VEKTNFNTFDLPPRKILEKSSSAPPSKNSSEARVLGTLGMLLPWVSHGICPSRWSTVSAAQRQYKTCTWYDTFGIANFVGIAWDGAVTSCHGIWQNASDAQACLFRSTVLVVINTFTVLVVINTCDVRFFDKLCKCASRGNFSFTIFPWIRKG